MKSFSPLMRPGGLRAVSQSPPPEDERKAA